MIFHERSERSLQLNVRPPVCLYVCLSVCFCQISLLSVFFDTWGKNCWKLNFYFWLLAGENRAGRRGLNFSPWLEAEAQLTSQSRTIVASSQEPPQFRRQDISALQLVYGICVDRNRGRPSRFFDRFQQFSGSNITGKKSPAASRLL